MSRGQVQLEDLRRELLQLRNLGRDCGEGAELAAHVERMKSVAVDLQLLDRPPSSEGTKRDQVLA